MNFWNALSRKFFGTRARSLEAQLELTEAYRRVFLANPSRQDQQVVLADMAAKSGWNQITAPGVASDQLWFNEGKRSNFASVFSHLALSDDDVAALSNAVKQEIAVRESLSQ